MRFSSSPRIVVTDAQERAVLASLRCLDDAGARVAALASSRLAPGLWSRRPVERHVAPDPRVDRDGFLDGLMRVLGAGGRDDLLLPGTDASLLVISRHRDQLPPVARRGLPAAARVENALDRAALGAAAQVAGLDSPPSLACRTAEDALAAAHELGLPALVKPIDTVEETDGVVRRFAGRLVSTKEELRAATEEFSSYLLQEFAAGPVISVGGVFAAGRLLGSAVSRYERTWPVAAGNVCWSQTIEPPSGLLDRVERLVAELGWEGLFELELITCAGGRLAAIDFNPRAYGSLALAVAAGAPLPAIWSAHALGEPIGPRRWSAAPGVRYRWGEADLRNLAVGLRSGTWTALRQARPRRRVTHAYFQRVDPAPLAARALSLARRGPGGTVEP